MPEMQWLETWDGEMQWLETWAEDAGSPSIIPAASYMNAQQQ